jgi:DNA-binding beta-propeller fold protein YncE
MKKLRNIEINVKRIPSHTFGIVGLILLLFLFACDDMHDKDKIAAQPTELAGEHLFILSEGLNNMNNSRLLVYSIGDGSINYDFFQQYNKRKLGDTANDMKRYGNRLYIVVNVSSCLEIIDIATGKSLRQIPLFNNNGAARQPRCIDFDKNNAYVCSFDGSLTRIDTANFEITGIVNCGRNPDGLCISNGKIYVSNSGGLDFPYYDHTVSVIDITTFRELKKIDVYSNPSHIEADSQGDVYLVARGNYGSQNYLFQKINPQSDTLETTFDDLDALNFTIWNDTAYLYNYNFAKKTFWVKLFDCKAEKLISDNFISDNTGLQTPYGISINKQNGDVYICDAKNHTVSGDVICFSKNGQIKYKITNCGLNPNKVIVAY